MKQYLRIYLLTLIVVAVSPAIFVYIVDPFQVFHSHFLHPPKYSQTQRYQKAGIIRSFLSSGTPYDAVVVGTSLSENFDPAVIEKELGWKVLDLSAKGAYPVEKKLLLEAALRTGRVKYVLWDIDSSYATARVEESSDESVFPYYLYKPGKEKLWKYLVNWSNVETSRDLLKGKGEWFPSPHRVNCWQMQSFHRGEFLHWSSEENLKKLDAEIDEARQLPVLPPATEEIEKGLKAFVLEVTRKYPSTEFVLFLPPYSTYYYARQHSQLENHLTLRRSLIRLLANEKNVKIFSFDRRTEITDNIFNYRDMNHYSESVSDEIIRSIARDKDRLLPQGLEQELINFRTHVRHYGVRKSLSAPQTPMQFDSALRLLSFRASCEKKDLTLNLRRSSLAPARSCYDTFVVKTNPLLRVSGNCFQRVYLPKCYELQAVDGVEIKRSIARGVASGSESLACPREWNSAQPWVREAKN